MSQVKNYVVVETACIVIIFVISGLALKTEEIAFAIKHPGPLIYGLVAILGVTPCLGFVTIRLPLHPTEFVIGTPFCLVRIVGLSVSNTSAHAACITSAQTCSSLPYLQ